MKVIRHPGLKAQVYVVCDKPNVKLLEHSTALELCAGMSVANFAVYLSDSMSAEPSCNVCHTPGSQHVNQFLAMPSMSAACSADNLV